MDFLNLPENLKEQIRLLPTPSFIFNMQEIKKQFITLNNLFSEFLPRNFKKNWLDPSRMDGIYYALKCNSMPNVVDTLRSVGCKFEVNNYFELLAANNMDMPSNEMINSNPITSSENIKLMKNEGIDFFCVDSKDQIDNLSINAPGSKIYVRLIINDNNADLDLNSRLGIGGSEIPDLLNYAESKGLVPFGLTFHVGSQCTNKRSWGYGIRKAANIFDTIPSLKMLNIGGGLPVRYQMIPSHDIKGIVEHICDNLKEFFFDKNIIFMIELGRYLVANCAITATSIQSVNKTAKMPNRVVVDQSIFTGLIETLEFDSNFHYPIQIDNNSCRPCRASPYKIIGPSCDDKDVIAKLVYLEADLKSSHDDPSQRDRIYLLNTGAYTLDYSLHGHLSVGFNKCSYPYIYQIVNDKIIEIKL